MQHKREETARFQDKYMYTLNACEIIKYIGTFEMFNFFIIIIYHDECTTVKRYICKFKKNTLKILRFYDDDLLQRLLIFIYGNVCNHIPKKT